MTAKAKAPETEETVVQEPEGEDRLSDVEIDNYSRMGMTGRLPDALVETHKAFKHSKDLVHPGPLTAEGYATVLFLSKMSEALMERK